MLRKDHVSSCCRVCRLMYAVSAWLPCSSSFRIAYQGPSWTVAWSPCQRTRYQGVAGLFDPPEISYGGLSACFAQLSFGSRAETPSVGMLSQEVTVLARAHNLLNQEIGPSQYPWLTIVKPPRLTTVDMFYRGCKKARLVKFNLSFHWCI